MIAEYLYVDPAQREHTLSGRPLIGVGPKFMSSTDVASTGGL